MLLFIKAKCTIVQQSGSQLQITDTIYSNTEIMAGCRAVFTLGSKHCTFGFEPHYACVIDLSMAAVYHCRRKIAVSHIFFIYFFYVCTEWHISVKKCNTNAAKTAICSLEAIYSDISSYEKFII